MRFGILGPFEALDGQGCEVDLGGPKQRAVLAILLLHAGEVVSGERLIDELWGEHAPRTAAKTIQVYVSHLRKTLGDGVLATRAGGYVLHVDRAEIDRNRFEALVAVGRQALQAGESSQAAVRLREALGLWRGPPLLDFSYEPFAQSEIASLQEARLCALEDRIDADLGCGDHGSLVAELEALVREHPLRERLRAHQMVALYRAGRPADALESYMSARQALVEELGIEPGRRLRELHQAILEQDPALDLLTGSAAARPRPSVQPGPSNLPLRMRPLVGRGRELRELRELLTGESEASLPRALARRLGGQRTVLILDNFEQLLHAAPLIADLLAEALELRVLATSQIPLRLSIERVFTLGPLDRGDAVALFRQRARARDRTFEPTDQDLEAAGRICELLDDTPLAIELAASRLQSLGTRELLERLTRPLALLTRSDRDVPARQRSLRATIDWTFALLKPGQRELFARLGVFAGPVPLTAVEAIADVDADTAVLDDLETLIMASLVRRDPDQRAGPRFLMPQALRDYATERLRESGEEDAIRRRHAERVLTVVHAGRLWKWGATTRQRADLAALTREIRSAVAWARAHDPVLHVRLCAAAGFYWICRGVISEAQDELRTAVDSEAGALAERAWVMTLLAKCLQVTDSGSETASLAERALATWHGVADETERAIGLTTLSWVYRWLRSHKGIDLAEEALEQLRRTHDRELTLRGLVYLVHALADFGLVDRAEPLLDEAAVLSREDPVYELDAIRGDIAELRGDYIQAARHYARALAWSSRAGEAHQSLMDLHALAVSLARTGHGEAALEVAELHRIQEARTGRSGQNPEWTRMLEEAVELARAGAGAEAAQAARARARALSPDEAARRALTLAEGAVGSATTAKQPPAGA